MRKRERGEGRDTTTHLIKIQVFIHARHVTKFSKERYMLARVVTVTALWHMWVGRLKLSC